LVDTRDGHPISRHAMISGVEPAVAQLPPRGHYLAHEVGLLAGVSGRTIGSWARYGLIDSSQSNDVPRVYSFQDAAEAIVVHALLDVGVAHRDIRRAVATLREEFGSWPLSTAPLYALPAPEPNPEPTAQGRGVVVLGLGEAFYDIGRRGWQSVAAPGILDGLQRVVGLLRRGGWVARELQLENVEIDPDRLSGRPTIRGRRLAVEKVAQLAAEDGGIEILRQDYDLDDGAIRDAVRWYEALRAAA
jgi:uncharacterized protein (DUF433 family)/DNA-binding transcriptional MerR regulator